MERSLTHIHASVSQLCQTRNSVARIGRATKATHFNSRRLQLNIVAQASRKRTSPLGHSLPEDQSERELRPSATTSTTTATTSTTTTSNSTVKPVTAVKSQDHSDGEPQQAKPSSSSSTEEDTLSLPVEESSLPQSPMLASLSLLGVAVLLGGGYVFKDQIKAFLEFFITAVEDWGPWGYLAYAAVYTSLEVLAVPAIPLTMTAGVIFGQLPGTLVVSASGTLAATIAFLIARYAARDKVYKFASKHPRFAAIDRAIGKNGLKFVTLLRLSPLLPLAASNYLYGLTSVDLGSYVLGSWIGMLPGTYAYVGAGHVGRSVLLEGEGSLNLESWQVALGLGVTLVALGFVGQMAKKAIDDMDDEEQGSGK